MKVTSSRLDIEDNFIYGMVSNSSSVGGMKGLIGDNVDFQDGVFEVTLIREIRNALDFQQLINAFMTQRLESCDMIYSFKTNNITFESPDNIKWTLDGEFGENTIRLILKCVLKR